MASKTILITGATAGIGEAAARKFSSEGHRCIITGRRQDRLNALRNDLGETNTLALCFDVRNLNEVQIALDSLPDEWKDIDILLNNAGLAAGLSSIDEGDLDDWERMIDTNIKGLLYVSRIVLPWMKQRGEGHVINVGSTAGKETYRNGNVYCATKHAVDSLTKAMRIDMLPHGIKVSGVCPGAAETEFSLVRFHGDEQKAKDVYNGYEPMTPEGIADVIWFVANAPNNIVVNDIVITSLAQANSFYTYKV